MPQPEKPRKYTLRVTKEKKQRKFPEILTNSKIVITGNLKPAYQLENGMVVITDELNKRLEDWYDSTVKYIALCLEALSSDETQLEPHNAYPHDKNIVTFPIGDNWYGWGRIEESSADKRVFRLYSAFL
jgi:hypothetical protein